MSHDEALDFVIKLAEPYGLQNECVAEFADSIIAGATPDEAAWHALCAWDI